MDLKGLGTKEVGPAYESFLTLNRHQGLVRLRQLPDFFSYLPAPVAGVCHFLPNNTTVWQKGPEIPYINGSLMSFGSNFWKRIAWAIFPCDYKANGHAISETELILIQYV